MMLPIAGIAIAVALLLATPADARSDYQCDATGIPSDFDAFFYKAAKRHLPLELRDNWCVVKTVCWIESRLNPEAVSPVGAEGLCQVMPATAADLEARGKWRGKLRSAKANAEASAIRLKQGWDFWIYKRTTECRSELMIAGYNAGEGNIEQAHILSGGKRCWEGIRPFLPEVTGHHARETINYVSRFWEAYRKMRGYGL